MPRKTTSFILPGLESQDSLVLDYCDVDIKKNAYCALAMDKIKNINALEQFEDLISPHRENNKISESISRLFSKTQKKPIPRSVTIQKCGHEFCAIPFLFHVMSTKFNCPVCRGGSGNEIKLTEKLPNIQSSLWDLLVILSQDSREKRIMEQENEDHETAVSYGDFHMESLSLHELVTDVMNFFVAFQIRTNTGEHTGGRCDLAFLNLRHVTGPDVINILEHNDNTNITTTNGPYPVARPVGKILRACSWFSFKLAVNIQNTVVELYESEILDYPSQPTTSQNFVVGHSGARMILRYDNTPYENGVLLKKIEYHFKLEDIRPLLYGLINTSP